jgi:Flp pilus assembly protein TadG
MTTQTAGHWRTAKRMHNARGQSLIEFALMMPLAVLMALGVVEVAYALLDQHIVTKLAREGSNLISRDTSLQDAGTAMTTMSSPPVDFSDGSSRLIFSVIRVGSTTGTANFGHRVMVARRIMGSLNKPSKLNMAGSGSFGGAPDFEAANADTNTGLRVTNLPAGLATFPGATIYVTEIYTTHPLITPVDGLSKFGLQVPNILYSIAYF